MTARSTSTATIACLVFATWAAAVARAGEGRIELNGAAAEAGGVTLGDAPGYPVTLDRPGSYLLTGNLVVPAGVDGVLATSDGVDLDLNGFAILGSAVCSGPPGAVVCSAGAGRGIAGAAAGLSVRHGRVTGFPQGGLALGAEARVEDVHSEGNGGDGVSVGPRSAVERCLVARNAGRGIAAGANSSVIGNVVSGNNLLGLQIGSGTGFSANSVNENTAGAVSGGVEIGGNVCDGSPACVCVPVPPVCTGKCGSLGDGCGGSVDCSTSGGVTCSGFQTCGGGGVPNQCGCTPTGSCSAAGLICGSVSNGCGGAIACGSCPAGSPKCCGDSCVPATSQCL